MKEKKCSVSCCYYPNSFSSASIISNLSLIVSTSLGYVLSVVSIMQSLPFIMATYAISVSHLFEKSLPITIFLSWFTLNWRGSVVQCSMIFIISLERDDDKFCAISFAMSAFPFKLQCTNAFIAILIPHGLQPPCSYSNDTFQHSRQSL